MKKSDVKFAWCYIRQKGAESHPRGPVSNRMISEGILVRIKQNMTGNVAHWYSVCLNDKALSSRSSTKKKEVRC